MDKFNNAEKREEEKEAAATEMGNVLFFVFVFFFFVCCYSGESSTRRKNKIGVVKRLLRRKAFSAIKPIIWHLFCVRVYACSPLAFVHSVFSEIFLQWNAIKEVEALNVDHIVHGFYRQIFHIIISCCAFQQCKN